VRVFAPVDRMVRIVFPLPIDLITSITQVLNGSKKIGAAGV